MKKSLKRFVATGVLAGMMGSLVLSGCGKKANPAKQLDLNGQSFIAQFYDVEGTNGKPAAIVDIMNYDGKLFVNAYNSGDDYVDGGFITCLNPEDMTSEGIMTYGQDLTDNVDLEANLPDEDKEKFNVNTNLLGMAVSDDNIKVLAEWYAYDFSAYEEIEQSDIDPDDLDAAEEAVNSIESIQKSYAMVYDRNYNLISVDEISTDFISEDEYIHRVVFSEKGDIYFLTNHWVFIIDKDYNLVQSIKVTENWSNNLFETGNGDMYVSYYNDNWESKCSKISSNSSKLGEELNLEFGQVMNVCKSLTDENVLYISKQNVVCECDMVTAETTDLFKWLDIDIDGGSVSGMCVDADGTIYAVTYDWDTDSAQIAKIYKVNNSEVAQKIEIRLAAVASNDSTMDSAIVAFNKSQDKYHVTAEYYYDWEKEDSTYEDAIVDLNNAIVGSSGLDIIGIDGLDVRSLVNKGVLEDLKPYVEQSDINLNDYNENIINSCFYNGKLVTIPRSFDLQTIIVSDTMIPASKNTWTMDEMIDYANANPGSMLEAYITRGEFVESYIGCNLGEYVDWNTGTVDFSATSFRKVLEYAASLPEEYDWANIDYDFSIADALAQGQVLSQRMYISEPSDIQMIEAYFKVGANYIGFPNADGKNKNIMTIGNSYAIAANSPNKEAAWEFLQFYLSRERSEWDFSFPCKNDELQKEFDKELEHAGEPNGSAMSDDTGFEYSFHYCTQEEIDKVLELINNAEVISVDRELLGIISEEADAYFAGQKSLDEVIGIIQSRVYLYVSEKM